MHHLYGLAGVFRRAFKLRDKIFCDFEGMDSEGMDFEGMDFEGIDIAVLRLSLRRKFCGQSA